MDREKDMDITRPDLERVDDLKFINHPLFVWHSVTSHGHPQRKTLHIPLDVLGEEHCLSLLDSDDITGKVVAIKPSWHSVTSHGHHAACTFSGGTFPDVPSHDLPAT